MDVLDAIKARHSVRQYQDRPLRTDVLTPLQAEIDACSQESGLHIQLVSNEPKAFGSFMAHYGKFSGVKNYVALVGKKDADLRQKCGYYGERIVLKAQQLGLNTCWVAMTYKKVPSVIQVEAGEKLCLVIAIGYGETQGVAHTAKSCEQVTEDPGVSTPDWFYRGIDAALLAPTAMNQQKFKFSLSGDQVSVKPGLGFYAKIDLGIVMYHFEMGAGKENFTWLTPLS